MLTGPDDPRHGTMTAYNHHKCRCTRCAEHHRETTRRQKADRIARGLAPDDPLHGTDNAYCNWNCRCEPCKAAHAETLKVRRYRRSKATPTIWTINDVIPDDMKVTQEVA